MKLKTYLVATTAIFTASSVYAADMPVAPEEAEPIEYVQACNAFGAGYFQLPGKDTCLKVGGRIRAQVRTGNLSDDAPDDGPDWDSYVRGYSTFESTTATDFGTIYTYSGFVYQWDQSADDPDFWADDAFMTFSTDYADFNVGLKLSEYYGFLGYSWMQIGGRNWAEHYPLQASVNIPVEDFTVSFAIEDASYTNGKDDGLNFVGAVDYGNKFFDVRMAAILFDTVDADFEAETGDDNDYGYAFNLSTEIRPTDKLRVSLGAMYAQSASALVNLNAASFGEIAHTFELIDKNDPKGGYKQNGYGKFDANHFDRYGVQAFSLIGGMRYALRDDVDVMFEASYLQFETDQLAVDWEGEALRLSGSVVWKPAPGLGIAFAAGYNELSVEGSAADSEGKNGYLVDSTTEDFKIGTRIQYTFW